MSAVVENGKGGSGGHRAWQSRIVGHDRVAPDQLVANPFNHRKHPQAQRDALAAAIRDVGFIRSVTVNRRTGNLIDGHERVWQALTSEQPWIDVEYVDLSEEDERKALATLDKIGEMAEVDPEILDSLLREIETGEPALQELLASMAEDAGLYVGDEEQPPAPEPEIDRADELRAKWGTEAGQLWEIVGKAGTHRLLCGDSTDGAAVGRLMGGQTCDLCFTSPPYLQQRDYGAAITDWDALMQGVFRNIPAHDKTQVLVNLGIVHREGEWLPYWDGWIEWMRAQGWRRFGWYVWDQGSGLPGDWNGRFAPSHEFIFHFNRDAQKPLKTVRKHAKSIKDRTGDAAMRMGADSTQKCTSGKASLQTHKIPDSVLRVQRQCGRIETGDYHPAVYPVEFAASVMKCWPGIAYEPFCGSGTTIIAAEREGRVCYGMELHPPYVAVILERCTAAGMEARLTE